MFISCIKREQQEVTFSLSRTPAQVAPLQASWCARHHALPCCVTLVMSAILLCLGYDDGVMDIYRLLTAGYEHLPTRSIMELGGKLGSLTSLKARMTAFEHKHTHTYTHVRASVHIHTHTQPDAHTHTCIHTCIHTHTRAMHTHTHTRTHTCIHTYTRNAHTLSRRNAHTHTHALTQAMICYV
jgi:hypothetical protein